MLQAPLPLAGAVQLHQPENANAADANAGKDAVRHLRTPERTTVGAAVHCNMEPARQLNMRSGSSHRAALGDLTIMSCCVGTTVVLEGRPAAMMNCSAVRLLQRPSGICGGCSVLTHAVPTTRSQQASQSPRRLAPRWTHRKRVTTMPRRVSRWRGLTENTCAAGSPQFQMAGHCTDQTAARCASWMSAAVELPLGSPAHQQGQACVDVDGENGLDQVVSG